ncbi:putative exported polysaccharide deacetylase [Listeria floridensis FSL S10-1187]|uniref:Exported polysaccharide deacetylase n=1 Tax=Listeria floridensis FSL S10-1187 TaxID=1265817 RepID=A0ABN0REY7_9LIST|nr:polysaccharide deacetylase family protein [Listeria floridensis]EUJ31391.1 putative exported polysaccharide deacetylase [Listeria floridensis FSL S10-1187]
MSFHVLMYHELRERGTFKADEPSPISVKQNYEARLPQVLFSFADDFTAQMEMLVAEGFHAITLQDVRDFYEKGKELPKKAVLITFDDAFQSVAKFAYPVLKRLGLRATLFVVRGWLSDVAQDFETDRSVVMSSAELMELRDVFTLANHTTNLHVRTEAGSTWMQTVSLAELKEDLDTCAEIVDVPDVFAYPFGIYDEQDAKRLKKCGIRYAFTTKPGLNKRETAPLELHRQVVALGMTSEELKQILS